MAVVETLIGDAMKPIPGAQVGQSHGHGVIQLQLLSDHDTDGNQSDGCTDKYGSRSADSQQAAENGNNGDGLIAVAFDDGIQPQIHSAGFRDHTQGTSHHQHGQNQAAAGF